ncbi:MAG TPA: WYL domain-containing transcriptional regulator, partial [Chloroflexi bacterium]|nr:WYL domain-containing transcriptional regulator [Chloroflexota bacterium]
MPRGRRESHWLVIRRCLAIIRRAQRGPATRAELMQAVLHEVGTDAYGEETDEEARQIRLEKDLERIRDRLLVDLYFDRKEGRYIIRDLWTPLLDLPDEDLETIAWLEETFGPESPQHDEVREFLDRIRFYLPMERRLAIERCRTALAVDLRQRDEDEISEAVWEGLTRALVERRRVEFLYRSPQQEDGEPRRHVVDPYERYFDTARGHYYLRGWCHYTEGPPGRYPQHRYFDYRLGRISDLRLLPNKLPPTRPSGPRYEVTYELAPKVARLGITRHRWIEIESVEWREDGGAVVRGWTESLFWAVQALLHYGPNCRVL